MDEITPEADADPAYVYKPTMFAAPRELHLRSDAIEWRTGFASGRVPYTEVRRVRVSFRPVNFVTYRFVTEIWTNKGPKLEIASTSWKSMVEQQQLDASYRAFVIDLHGRLALAGSRALFQSGSPAFLYWPGVAVFVAASLGLAVLTVRALETSAAGAAFVAGFLLLFLWQAGSFFKRNRPRTYTAGTIPEAVLPRT